MKIVATTLPKGGLHALEKACSLLGVPVEIQHTDYARREIRQTLYIYREPRNMVVSHIFWEGKEPTPENLIACINDYHGFGHIKKALEEYAGWMTDKHTFVISYEELIGSPAGIARLSEHLGVTPTGEEFGQLPGGTDTWHHPHSNWQDHWTDEVEAAYQAYP